MLLNVRIYYSLAVSLEHPRAEDRFLTPETRAYLSRVVPLESCGVFEKSVVSRLILNITETMAWLPVSCPHHPLGCGITGGILLISGYSLDTHCAAGSVKWEAVLALPSKLQ